MTIRRSMPGDGTALADIWLRSVRASHTFLTEADIQSLLPSVRDYFALPDLELWILCTPSGTPVGFMGLSGTVVDALFLAPEHLRQGGGTALLDHARRLKGGPLSVEVNEQNPAALQFYLARGFTVVGRSPVDAEGRPYPLLQLREVSEWPAPVEILNADGRSPVVLLCEHAANFLPDEYGGLGLDAPELRRHIAWDIGAAAVVRALSRELDAPALLGTCSRLLIDLNRPLHVPSSIVTRSEATDIPGNTALTAEERQRRISRVFRPYHAAVATILAARAKAGLRTVIVAIHSFTPVFHGVARKWHAGILFEKAAAFAQVTMDRLRAEDPELLVGANVPYAVSPDEDYGLLVYGDNIGNPAILIEIRQDLLTHEHQAQAWAGRLARSLAIDVAIDAAEPGDAV